MRIDVHGARQLAAATCHDLFSVASGGGTEPRERPQLRSSESAPPPGTGKDAGAARVFSPANKRFTLLIISLMVIFVCGATAMTVLSVTGHDPQILSLAGFAGTIVAIVAHSLKAEGNQQESRENQKVILDKVTSAEEVAKDVAKKTNGGLTKAVETVAEKVMEAASKPAPGQEAMPKTRDELDELLTDFARRNLTEFGKEICDRIADEAALRAAAKAAEIAAKTASDEMKAAAAEIERRLGKLENRPPAP